MAFIISKRNFLVRRADGSNYLIQRDFIGDIPEDVFRNHLVQDNIKSGLIAVPASHADKDIQEADEAPASHADKDIREANEVPAKKTPKAPSKK